MRRFTTSLLAFAAVAGAMTGEVLAADSLFDAADRMAATRTTIKEGAEVRKRGVSIDRAVVERTLLPAGQERAEGRAKAAAALEPTLDLALFPDAVGRFRRVDVEAAAEGGVVWSGDREDGIGTATLVVRDGRVTGIARLDERTFRIESKPDGTQWVSEIDESRLPRDKHRVAPAPRPGRQPAAPSPGAATRAVQSRPSSSAGSVQIDLLGAYTTTAKQATGDIVADIQLGVTMLNRALVNSGARITFRLVGTYEAVNYREATTTYDENLDDLTTGAALAAVRNERDRLGADLVTLIREGGAWCGMGWIIDSPGPSTAQWGMSVVARGCLPNQTLAHEIGHNMGLYHDRFVESRAGNNVIHFGFVNMPGRVRDIMSYPDACQHEGLNCSRVDYFSTPNRTYRGRRLGIPAGQRNAADATRLLGITAARVAAYRPTVVP
jgi:hypothetical protein